jgi:hypothetical protein
VQEGLGRDAADVEAGAAEVALLDEAHGQTELGGTERTGIAAGSRPENEYVELAVGHFPILALFAGAFARRPGAAPRPPADWSP